MPTLPSSRNVPGAQLQEDDKLSPSLQRPDPSEFVASSRMEANQLYTIAFERSLTPMMIADAGDNGNPVLYANPAFLELTGYGLSEVVGRDCRYLQGPGTSKTTIAEIAAAIAAELEITVTVLNYRKDGSEFWNQLHISPIRNDQGTVIHYFASQVDVTESRRVAGLEASERRLLKEVDHRAKNLMAVINSIVRLSNSDDPQRYASSVRERVQALADVHMLLAEKGWNSIALGELLGRQFRPAKFSAVKLDGPRVTIDATDAQPFALVIHELASNAALHGALATSSGAVDVTWRQLQPEGLEIVWQEHGGATPLTSRPKGFGTVMVDALVERQLKGSIQRDWLEEGLSLSITLPGKHAVTSASGR